MAGACPIKPFRSTVSSYFLKLEQHNHRKTLSGVESLLHLKSGDSYLRERESGGAGIFTIKDERHARYWMAHGFRRY